MEEDKKYLKDQIKRIKLEYMPCELFVFDRLIQAIENILNRLEQLEKENKELKNNCKKCIVRERLNEYVENSIPKSVIRDKIEEYKELEARSGIGMYLPEIQTLQELLGDENG
jgi:hypothetical protein